MSDNSDANLIKQEPCLNQTENVKSEPIAPSSSTIPKPTSSASAVKRSFVPNLSIDRSKKDIAKQEVEQDKKQTQKKERKLPGPNLNSARNRNNRNQNLIQAHSIFEAGPAESTKRFGNNNLNEGGYTKTIGSVSSSSNSVPASERAFKRDTKQPNESNLNIEKSLLIDNAVEDESQAYVKLKFETKDFDSKAENWDDLQLKELNQLNDLFIQEDESKEKLILFQLPDNLKLQDLEEGHIGKIRIRKSGRIELCVDDKKYLNVGLSVSGSFLQDAVALDVNDLLTPENKTCSNGKIVNLGNIKGKVVCSPKF